MKYLIYISILLFSFQNFAQNDAQKFNRTKWKELKGKIKYKKTPREEDRGFGGGDSGSDKRFYERNTDSKEYRENRSNRQYERANKPERRDSPSSDFSDFGNIANILMIILAVFFIAFIIYQIAFKNKKNYSSNAEIEEEQEEFDINTLKKSDLELALEKALAAEDYRRCIRIYFTFILKELSTNNDIYWERDKTNYDYLSEMSKNKDFHGFRNSVDVFEIVWYGKRNINLELYKQLEPEYKLYLEKITKSE